MDINQIIEKYGHDTLNELLDIALISKFKVPSGFWREFCLRHGLIKKTTKMISDNCFTTTETRYYKDGVYGIYEPRVKYVFRLKNGRGDYILYFELNEHQLEEWRKTQ